MSKDTFVWDDKSAFEFAEFMVADGTSPNHQYWGRDLMNKFKQSKMPKKDKDWEVVDLISPGGGKVIKASDISWEHWGLKTFDLLTINAVKRLSDGEVFSVGDNLSDGRITFIKIHDDGDIGLCVDQNACYVNLKGAKKIPPQKEQSKPEQPKKERIEVKDVSIKEILIRFEGPTLPQRKIDELKATIEKIINNEEWITASQNISEALREAEEKAFNAGREVYCATAMGQRPKYWTFEEYIKSKQ